MTLAVLVAWLAAGFVLLKGIQHVLGARIYLTSAVRAPDVAPIDPEQIPPGEFDLLTSVDGELQSARFRHVATPAGRVWGGIAYLLAWVPAIAAAVLLAKG